MESLILLKELMRCLSVRLMNVHVKSDTLVLELEIENSYSSLSTQNRRRKMIEEIILLFILFIIVCQVCSSFHLLHIE